MSQRKISSFPKLNNLSKGVSNIYDQPKEESGNGSTFDDPASAITWVSSHFGTSTRGNLRFLAFLTEKNLKNHLNVRQNISFSHILGSWVKSG